MIKLSDHFTYKSLFRFTYSSILMLLFSSIYGIVDGFFVSNYVGKTPFAALNFIMPVLMILGCIGFMFGTGGSAIISKLFGEKNNQKANEIFSMNIFVSIVLSIVLGVLGFIFLPQIGYLLGARGEMLSYSVIYGRIIIVALPFYILQYEFQCLFATSEKPKMGLYVTLAAGFANMILDWLFVAVFSFGLVGAAVATAISQFVGGIIPLIYYLRKNTSLLRLCKFKFDGKALLKTCTNGSSEFMSNISMSLVSMLYNYQLMKYAGEDGVSAYGVLMYVSMIFQAIFIGYSVGVAPIVGYNYGSSNNNELKSILKKSFVVIGVCSLFMFLAGEIFSRPLTKIFVSYDENLLSLTSKAFKIFSFSFLFSGISIFGSSFFTALNNGLISALISFLRCLVFQVVAVIVFPLIWKIDGIWFSIVFAEIMSVCTTICFLVIKKKKYNY